MRGLRAGMRTGMICDAALLLMGSVLLDRGYPLLDIPGAC